MFNFRQAEAKRRDHRTLGKQLNLFSIQDDAGGGLVFWHAKGSIIRRMIEEYWKQQHLQVKCNHSNQFIAIAFSFVFCNKTKSFPFL